MIFLKSVRYAAYLTLFNDNAHFGRIHAFWQDDTKNNLFTEK